MSRTTQSEPVRRMEIEQVEFLLIVALRVGSVRSEAIIHLRPEHFSRAEESYLALLWRVILKLDPVYPGRQSIPFRAVYDACVELAADPGTGLEESQRKALLGDEEYPEPPGLLDFAYDGVEEKELDVQYGLELLRRFAIERIAVDPFTARIRAAESGGRVLGDVSELYEVSRRATAKFESIGRKLFETLDVDITALGSLPVESCGLQFFDRFMGGGPSQSEVIGILGPTGGGKSTIVSQLACERIKLLRTDEKKNKNRKVFYFPYEDDIFGLDRADGVRTVGRIMIRVYAHLAQVWRSVIERPEDYGGYTTAANLRDYEREICRVRGGGSMLGETERLAAARRVLEGDWLLTFDMGNSERGSGGIREIVSAIRQTRDQTGYTPACVLIDSLDLLVLGQLYDQDKDPSKMMRRALIDGVRAIRKDIAREFGCDVWVTNQLDAASNNRSATTKGTSQDATDAKGWANALDFCWQFNKPDANHFTTFTLTKGRRGGFNDHQLVMKLMGEFARFIDMSEEYCVLDGQFALKEAKALIVPTTKVVRQTKIATLDDGDGGLHLPRKGKP